MKTYLRFAAKTIAVIASALLVIAIIADDVLGHMNGTIEPELWHAAAVFVVMLALLLVANDNINLENKATTSH